jgi:hypothetical protein
VIRLALQEFSSAGKNTDGGNTFIYSSSMNTSISTFVRIGPSVANALHLVTKRLVFSNCSGTR